MNQIRMITGEPRSGTSLMMTIIRALGHPISGDQYPDVDNEERLKRIKKMNPLGFWEIPHIVGRGLRDVPGNYDGRAVKIVSSGAYPKTRGNSVTGTPPENYDRAILCLRNPRAVAESQTGFETPAKHAGTDADEASWTPPRLLIRPEAFVFRTGGFLVWLAERPEVREKYLVVDYDDMVDDPVRETRRMSDHLGVAYQDLNIVDTDLRRSTLQTWPKDVREAGLLADMLYQHVRNRDWLAIRTVWKNEYEERVRLARLDRVRWTDTEFKTYRMIGTELYRQMRDNVNNVLDKLLVQQDFHDYTASPFFGLSKETYTIERPADIGDLTRPLVRCTHPDFQEDMTHERFRRLWVSEGRDEWA